MTAKRFLIYAAAIVLLCALMSIYAAVIAVAAFALFYAIWFLGDTDYAPHDPGPELESPPDELPADERYTPPPADPLPAWQKPLQAILIRLALLCSNAIMSIKAKSKSFGVDPLLTAAQTRLVGIISAATRQHGILIEKAILECLKDHEHLDVWCEPEFCLSHGDTNYHKAATIEGVALASLPYGDGDAKHRTVQVDLITFEKSSGVVRAYEIKRSHEETGSTQNLHIVRSLLLSYAETVKQLKPTRAEMWLINYYGTPSKNGGTYRLTRADLDAHFGCPIVADVEAATSIYRADLQTLLEAT